MRRFGAILRTWGGGGWGVRWNIGAELTFAAGLPVLVVGIAALAGWLWAFGPGPFDSPALAWTAVIAAHAAIIGLFFATGFHYENPVLFLSAIVMYAAAGVIGYNMSHVALAVSGASDVCVIHDVDVRVEVSGGGDGGVSSETFYEHVVTCPMAPVDVVSDHFRNGRVGDEVKILYDPSGRVDAHSVEEVENEIFIAKAWIFGVALLILLRVGYVLIAFRPVRRRQQRRWPGDGAGSGSLEISI